MGTWESWGIFGAAAAAAERLPLAHAGKVSLYLWTHWIECAHHITNPKTCDDDIVIGAETEPLKCLYRSSSSLLLALLADAATWARTCEEFLLFCLSFILFFSLVLTAVALELTAHTTYVRHDDVELRLVPLLAVLFHFIFQYEKRRSPFFCSSYCRKPFLFHPDTTSSSSNNYFHSSFSLSIIIPHNTRRCLLDVVLEWAQLVTGVGNPLKSS